MTRVGVRQERLYEGGFDAHLLPTMRAPAPACAHRLGTFPPEARESPSAGAHASAISVEQDTAEAEWPSEWVEKEPDARSLHQPDSAGQTC